MLDTLETTFEPTPETARHTRVKTVIDNPVEDAVTIRPARRSDCRAITRMIEELAKHHGDVPLISEDVLRTSVFSTDPWIQILVAERNERLVGYAGLVRGFHLHFGQRTMDIHHLYVTDAMRGRGVARTLIEASVARAQALGCEALTVSTQDVNTTAQDCYIACGFDAAAPNANVRFKMELS